MDEDDFQKLRTDVEVMKVDTSYIKKSLDELRAEVRILSDSMVAVGEVSRLCKEHAERGKEFDTFKALVSRHETYFIISGSALVIIIGFLFEIYLKKGF